MQYSPKWPAANLLKIVASCNFEPGRRFVWRSRRTGLTFNAEHLIDPADGGTRNLLRVEASSVLAILLWPILVVALKRALTQENQALKEFCESLSAD